MTTEGGAAAPKASVARQPSELAGPRREVVYIIERNGVHGGVALVARAGVRALCDAQA